MKKRTVLSIMLILAVAQASCVYPAGSPRTAAGSDRAGGNAAVSDLPREPEPAPTAHASPANERGKSISHDRKTSPIEYYYNHLDGNNRLAYDAILDGLEHARDTIELDGMSSETLGELFEMVLYDHPELFYIGADYYVSGSGNGHGRAILKPSYRYKGKKLEKRREEIKKATKKAIKGFKRIPSEYDKIKAVFEYVIDSAEYGQESEDNQNIYSVFVDKESVCAGYAKAVQYLLQRLGIETLYVSGKADSGDRHAWNIVKCNGKYYHLDATYGERGIRNVSESYIPDGLRYCYEYLCFTDKLRYKGCEADRFKLAKIPKCKSNDLDYYALNGACFKKYSEKVAKSMDESIRSGQDYWRCRFKHARDYEACLAKISGGMYAEKVAGYLGRQNLKTWYIHDDDMHTVTCWYSR